MRPKCSLWCTWVALLLVAVSAGAGEHPLAGATERPAVGPTGRAPVGARVRAADRETRDLLEVGAQASPLLHGLLTSIEQTDLIVMVSLEPPPPWVQLSSHRYHGSTRLLAAAGGQRYVAIWLDSLWYRRPVQRSRIALLAHELQHALEIAAAPDVVDQRGMVSLFERIGREVSPRRFETEAALDVESRVHDELSASAGPQSADRPR